MPGGTGTGANKGQGAPLINLGLSEDNQDPSDGGSRSSSRNASPAILSAELTLKVKIQMGRCHILSDAIFSLPADVNQFSLTELAALTAHVKEVYKDSLKEHLYFETIWPSALVEHPYFSDSLHMNVCRVYWAYKQAATRVKEALTPAVQIAVPTHVTTEHIAHSRLPDINFPTFSGDHSQSPRFKELFTSLILNNSTITDVKKLHYLRGCLKGRSANEKHYLWLDIHWAYHGIHSQKIMKTPDWLSPNTSIESLILKRQLTAMQSRFMHSFRPYQMPPRR